MDNKKSRNDNTVGGAYIDTQKGDFVLGPINGNELAGYSSAQLVSIQLGLGSDGCQIVDAILRQCGGLAKLCRADRHWLKQWSGLSDNSITRLQVALELAARAAKEELLTTDYLSSPTAVSRYLATHYLLARRECFMCLYLDAHHRVLDAEQLFIGTIDSASVYPREIVVAALRHCAVGIIVAHNHPSGCSEPSDADHRVTRRIKAALDLVDIRLLDHLILGQGEVFSFAKAGFL